jgi:hypothetical protein
MSRNLQKFQAAISKFDGRRRGFLSEMTGKPEVIITLFAAELGYLNYRHVSTNSPNQVFRLIALWKFRALPFLLGAFLPGNAVG